MFIIDKQKTKSYIEELDKKLLGEQENTESENDNTKIGSTTDKKTDKAKIKIEILNGSGSPSNLTKVTNSLKENGYTISKVGKTNSTAKTSIINKGKVSDDIVTNIKEILGIGTITSSTSDSSSTNITIILGKDYK